MGTEQPSEGPKLVRCEITGQMVPEDEIVEIDGRRVSAAGKEELLRRLRSGERLPGELERPTVLRRFACIFVDILLLGAVFALIQFTMLGTVFSNPRSLNVQRLVAHATMASVLTIVIGLAYFSLFHGLRGQTPGKMAGKIKVVNPDGTAISYPKALVRALFYDGPQLLAPLTFSFALQSPEVVNVFNGVGIVYGIANVLFALFDRAQQRALHDRLAGTRVIKLD
jgi:uncharacterized RDD family membrane protein YckC